MNKLKFKKGEIVSATKTFNGEIITGEFQGYRLFNDEIPDTVVGVVHVSGDRSYDVDVTSIRHYESEDERIIKTLQEYVKNRNWMLNGPTQDEVLAWLESQKEQKPVIDYIGPAKAIQHPDGTITQHKFGYLENKENEKTTTEVPLMKVYGFEVGDKVRLKDGDGRTHIIKAFEEVEGVHGPNFYHVEFEDNSARDGIYPGEEYPNGYYTNMVKLGDNETEVQKAFREGKNAGRKEVFDHPEEYGLQPRRLYDYDTGAERVDYKDLCDVVVAEMAKYTGDDFLKSPWAFDSTGTSYPLHFAKLGAKWQKEQKPTATINGEPIPTENHSVNIPLAEWSEEDEEHVVSLLKRLDGMCKNGATFTQTRFAVSEDMDWLKALRSGWKPTSEQMKALEECGECKRCIKELYEDLQKRYGTC